MARKRWQTGWGHRGRGHSFMKLQLGWTWDGRKEAKEAFFSWWWGDSPREEYRGNWNDSKGLWCEHPSGRGSHLQDISLSQNVIYKKDITSPCVWTREEDWQSFHSSINLLKCLICDTLSWEDEQEMLLLLYWIHSPHSRTDTLSGIGWMIWCSKHGGLFSPL